MTYIPPSSGTGSWTSSFGLGSPIISVDSPKASSGTRFIDPVTRDYKYSDATEQMKQMPPMRQSVLLALQTEKGSASAYPEFGFTIPKTISKRIVAEMGNAIRSALAHLTREPNPQIKIESINVERVAENKVRNTISYIDLTTGQPDEVAI